MAIKDRREVDGAYEIEGAIVRKEYFVHARRLQWSFFEGGQRVEYPVRLLDVPATVLGWSATMSAAILSVLSGKIGKNSQTRRTPQA